MLTCETFEDCVLGIIACSDGFNGQASEYPVCLIRLNSAIATTSVLVSMGPQAWVNVLPSALAVPCIHVRVTTNAVRLLAWRYMPADDVEISDIMMKRVIQAAVLTLPVTLQPDSIPALHHVMGTTLME